MNWGGPGFILSIIAICTAGWVFTTWIRARHGYPLEDQWFGTVEKKEPVNERQLELLTSENGDLKDKIVRLEDRIAVLERIATDPGQRTAREIEALRDS